MKFVLEVPDDIGKLVDQIRTDDPLRPSRRQQYTKIVIEWLEANGYLNHSPQSELEAMKRKIAQLEKARLP